MDVGLPLLAGLGQSCPLQPPRGTAVMITRKGGGKEALLGGGGGLNWDSVSSSEHHHSRCHGNVGRGGLLPQWLVGRDVTAEV